MLGATGAPVPTETLTFPLDPADAARLEVARFEVLVAERAFDELATSDTASGLATSLASTGMAQARSVLDDLLASMVTFTVHLRALPLQRVGELMREHPPAGVPVDEDDVDEATFVPALLAEAIDRVTVSDSPGEALAGLTRSQVDALLAPCAPADLDLLAGTAVKLARTAARAQAGGG